MHHLKKWFGIKDWQGPDPKPDASLDSSLSDNTTLQKGLDTSKAVNEAENTQVNNSISTDNIDILRVLPENDSVFRKYNDKLENWLRQYIPAEKDECAQCRLVTTTTVGAGYVGVMVYIDRLAKGAELSRRAQKSFRGFQVSFSIFMAINLYFYLFKTGLCQKPLEGESMTEFKNRLYREELEWYSEQFRKFREWKNKTGSDDSRK